MKIGLLQYSPFWEDKEKNKEQISTILNIDCSVIDLIIFPEMTLTGFSMNSEKLTENLEGESTLFFKKIAVEKNMNIIAGVILTENEKIFNTAVHINSLGEVKSIYKKIHPFTYSKEDENYEAGKQTQITNINDWKIGLSVCYDLRFPELYRQYAKQRTQLIVNIANWPIDRIEHWSYLLKARAIENQCYVVGVNRVGNTGKLNYNGMSSIYDPMGKEVLAIENQEGIFTADIDIEDVKMLQKELPFLDDIKLI